MTTISSSKQKKNTSLSFSDPHIIKDTQKNHYRQFRSHQQKYKQDQQKSIQQKVLLNKLLNKKIQQHNFINSNQHKLFIWQLVLIDQKRTISGFKAKVKCKLIPSQLYVIIRLSFTQDFLKYKSGQKFQQGMVFIELQQLNFQINKGQKRNFQIQLQKMMKPLWNRTIFAQDQQQHKWVKQLFYSIENIIQVNEYQKRCKKGSECLNRKQILTKYILYHPPVCVTWSPKGLFCLTQNRVPANKSSLIGNPLSFKQNIQVPKVSLKTVIQQQILQQSSTTQQQTPQISIFNWDMGQQLQLFALSNHKRQISAYYKDNNKKDLQSKKKLVSNNSLVTPSKDGNNISSSGVKSDYMILEYGINKKISGNMRKIYERYFINKNELFQYDLTRGQKLNVYFVMSQNRRYEDQMLYLMQKINSDRLKPVLQVVLSTILYTYPNLLSVHNNGSYYYNSNNNNINLINNNIINSNKSIDSTRYFIINQLFKQQKNNHISINNNIINNKSNTNNNYHPSFHLSQCLKSIIIENQFHTQSLQSYFTSCFKMLKINHAQSQHNIYYLGSYQHFDQYKAQRILIKLLEQYQYNYQLNLKNQKEIRLIIQSKQLQRIKKYIKIKKIAKFPPLKDQWLLTDQNRKLFIQTILPILLIRDRNYQEFYYRQLQRIITTNQKIIKFNKHLSQIIKKVQQQRHDFIKHLINQYSIYEQQKKLKHNAHDVRRLFTVYCQKCQKPNKTFEIAQTQKLRICNRCLQSTNKKI